MTTMKDLGTPKKNTWCPACGNFGILMAFKRALIDLGLERDQVVLVSGIGCHGKMVNYVNVNGFHGIHGRGLPLATGIKLANSDLTVVCFQGDADCYDEGMEHFIHTCRRNLDMTLIVHDNMILGLTTGQTTSTSQRGFKTKSTPFGSIPSPVKPLALALVSDATFVSRGFAGDMLHLQKLIVEAVKHRGFALIDVFQPCVTFNRVNTYDFFKKRVYKLEETDHDVTDKQKALEKALEWGDKIPIGILYKVERPTYRDSLPQLAEKPLTKQEIKGIDITDTLEKLT
jgi:2-oxoglutarate ferredoxin oxidoreductase subunit beta